jgi:hypothetical protein
MRKLVVGSGPRTSPTGLSGLQHRLLVLHAHPLTGFAVGCGGTGYLYSRNDSLLADWIEFPIVTVVATGGGVFCGGGLALGRRNTFACASGKKYSGSYGYQGKTHGRLQ